MQASGVRATGTLATLGDLVEDVVVRLAGPVNVAADTATTITRRRGGSAANVASAAAVGGHPSRFLGQVGTDAIGDALLAEMRRDGVDVGMVRRNGTTGTIVALVDHTGERSMLTDRRACIELSDPDPAWLDGVAVLHVPLYSLCLGAIATTATTLIGWAHEARIDVSIDVSSSSVMLDMGLDSVRSLLGGLGPSVLLANRDEAALLGLGTATDLVPGTSLTDTTVVVKRGPDVARVIHPDAGVVEVPAIAVVGVTDTTGAGDAFAAGFLTHPAGWRDDPDGACRSGHRAAAALLRDRCGVGDAAELTSRARP
jgi:sugar/nucleoside kinase (ribokinase family)